MDQLSYFWTHLSDAQATLIAAAGTIFSAFIVAILAPIFLKNSVKGIEEAAALAKKNAESISENFGGLNEQFSAFEKGLAGLQNKLNDFTEQLDDEPASSQQQINLDMHDEEARKNLRKTWFELRDHLEEDAADVRLNGHTRAKYGRIDRRDPPALFDAMQADGNLRGERSDWNRAQELYFNYRGKNSPPPTDVVLAELTALKKKLLRASFEPRKSTRRNGGSSSGGLGSDDPRASPE